MAWYGYGYEYECGYEYAFLTKIVAGIYFLVKKKEYKKRETTDVGSHLYALHQLFFPPLPPPQKHD